MLKKILSIFGSERPESALIGDTQANNQKTTHTIKTSHASSSAHIDHSKISANALKVISGLQEKGYSAYLVGGGVRDLLLELNPKDFDVATNATPEQIRQVFRNARIIGRRFKIVHVRYGREIIEVTTFRANHNEKSGQQQSKTSDKGQLLRDNVYGDLRSDAFRRDFTVNALYYNPSNQQLIDYTEGLLDLNQRCLRIIGKPEKRYTEDPVRLLRAIRFAAKLGFKLAPKTEAPIQKLSHLLSEIPAARLFDESLKLLLSGQATATLKLLNDYNLLDFLFPAASDAINNGNEFEQRFIEYATLNTDKRIRQRKRVTPAFIFAAFLWPALKNNQRIQLETKSTLNSFDALQQAANSVIEQQLSCTSIPKRFLIPMREIWTLQDKFLKRDTKRAYNLLEHKRFRAAYDFILLREQAGEDLNGLGNWWTQFQEEDEAGKTRLLKQTNTRPHRRRRPRKRPAQSTNKTSQT